MDFTTNPGLTTELDPIVEPLILPALVTSGTAPQLAMADGLARGQAIVGRCRLDNVVLGLKVAPIDETVEVILHFSTDETTPKWWEKNQDNQRYSWSKPRVFNVVSQGKDVGAFMLKGLFSSAEFRYRLEPELLDDDGFLVIEIMAQEQQTVDAMQNPLTGVRLDSIIVGSAAGGTSAAQFSGATPNTFWGEYALVMPGSKPQWVSLELTEKPPLASFARHNQATRFVARAARKGGVLARRGLREVLPGSKIAQVSKNLKVELFDAENRPLEVNWRPTHVGLDVEIPAGDDPMYLRVALPPSGWNALGYSKHSVWQFVES